MQEHLYQEAKQHFNEPILLGFRLCRCIGYAEDDNDCYLIARDPHKRNPVWHTFCGGYTYLDRLRGQRHVRSTTGEDWDDFTRADSLLENNGAPKENDFLLKLKGSARLSRK